MSDTTLNDILPEIRRVIEQRIPFNRILGVRVDELSTSRVKLRIDMREELVGNFVRGNLHGGVISAILDLTGGVVTFMEMLKSVPNVTMEAGLERFAKLGTIDLRIDYLRAGLGSSFVATGYMLRFGNKVSVSRMELHNDSGELIAVGTGAYVVG